MSTDVLDELVARTRKKYGDAALYRASERARWPRLPSGSLSLDMAMGGGWPVNTWTEIAGFPSSGKTAILHKTIAVCQQKDPDFQVLWVAVEDYDEAWASTLGVDTSRINLFDAYEMAPTYDFMAEATASKALNMIVLDSLPALMPDDEGEKSVGDPTVATGARLTGKFFRKAKIRRDPAGTDRPMLGVFINQWRSKPGSYAPNGQTPRDRPGGAGKDYAYGLRLEVSRAEYIDEDLPGRGKAHVGQTMKAVVAKNKTFAPGRVASVDLYFADTENLGFAAGDYDTVKELAMLGILTEAITRAGAYYDVGPVRVKAKEGIFAHLRGDLTAQEQLADDIRRKTLERA